MKFIRNRNRLNPRICQPLHAQPLHWRIFPCPKHQRPLRIRSRLPPIRQSRRHHFLRINKIRRQKNIHRRAVQNLLRQRRGRSKANQQLPPCSVFIGLRKPRHHGLQISRRRHMQLFLSPRVCSRKTPAKDHSKAHKHGRRSPHFTIG